MRSERCGPIDYLKKAIAERAWVSGTPPSLGARLGRGVARLERAAAPSAASARHQCVPSPAISRDPVASGRGWRILHLAGCWYLSLIFAQSYLGRLRPETAFEPAQDYLNFSFDQHQCGGLVEYIRSVSSQKGRSKRCKGERPRAPR